MVMTMKYLIDFLAMAILYVAVFFRKWKSGGMDVLLVNTLMYVYLAFVLFFTLMPVIVSLPFIFNHPYRPMNMIPFLDVSMGRGDFFRQAALNVVMTIPFGFLFPLTQRGRAGLLKTVFFCFLMSLGIELMQPLLNGFRSSDVTDLITNVIGGTVGYGAYVLFRPAMRWILDRLKNVK